MRKTINVPPPTDFADFSPSELFRYFFQIGHWTEDSFSDEFQNFTRGKLVSTVTINKWKNRDVIPTRYFGPFFKFVESLAQPEIATEWITAFETVWARHSSGRSKISGSASTLSFSDAIKSQHQRWINQRYTENRKGGSFSAEDIYVPLQLSDTQDHDVAPQDVEGVIEHLSKAGSSDRNIDWVFISGGPGSGKSMTALHMANRLCDADVFPIYIRGSRLSKIDIDVTEHEQSIADVFSIRSFLKHFRASSSGTAILILDGIDEIDRAPHAEPNKLDQFLSELTSEKTACAAHNKTLKILLFGRDNHIQFAKSQVGSVQSQHLSLLSLDGSAQTHDAPGDRIHGEDLRAVWWGKYLAATGYMPDPTLPDFLTTEYDDFLEFGTDPLLSYLICHTALGGSKNNPPNKLPHERVNELTHLVNKNKIYQTIFNRLALDVKPSLDPRRFYAVLQHIALAIWHNADGRSVSLKSVHDGIQNPETQASFQALGLSNLTAKTLPDTLITAFYYRLSQNESAAEQTMIEFTHKSFSNYLTSTLIFDQFTQLISAIEKESGIEAALKGWTNISHKGLQSPSLADFCQNEAALRFDALSKLNWDLALKIIRRHIHSDLFSGAGLMAIADIQRSTSLLFFIWSCLNLERQKRSNVHFPLSNTSKNFGISDLKSIQRPNALEFESGSLNEPSLRDMTFLTPALSALHVTVADLSQLSFSLGHMENLICEDTSFAMTYWNHVKVTGSEFSRSVFQQAILHHWRAINSHVSHCFFQGSRFEGAKISTCTFKETFFSQCHFADVEFSETKFENVVFDRCIFTGSSFGHQHGTSELLGVKFRHCTFMNMDQALANIPKEHNQNPISVSMPENPMSEVEGTRFQTLLEELL